MYINHRFKCVKRIRKTKKTRKEIGLFLTNSSTEKNLN